MSTTAIASTESRFLSAIKQVETRNNPYAIGAKGELGAYQFRKSTWEIACNEPFYLAQHPVVADRVAKAYLKYIKARLMLHGLEANDWQCAAAWNSGITSVISNRIPPVAAVYAVKVVAAMSDY